MNWLYYSAIIFTVAAITSAMTFQACLRKPHLFSALQANRLLRVLILGLFIAPLLMQFVPKESLKLTTTKVIHENNFQKEVLPTLTSTKSLKQKKEEVVSTEVIIFALIATVFFLLGFKYLKELRKLMKSLSGTFIHKKFKNIEVRISDEIKTPFACWLPGRTIIVLPLFLLENKVSFYQALAHEIQHHRHGDTVWAHVMSLLKVFFGWNPFIYLFEKNMNEIQELACDEALVGQKESSFQEYTSCLLEVAQQSVEAYRLPAGTTGMALSRSGRQLKQRIVVMKWYQKNNLKRSTLLLPALVLSIISSVAIASGDFIGSSKVTEISAKELVKKASQKTDFPVEMNDRILEQLNFYVGTTEGRNFIKDSLKRKESVERIMSKKFKEYNAPSELLAVALMESGFKNLPAKVNRSRAAGIWQFIPGTAHNFGLKNIGEAGDERLDVEKETDAAMRLLSALNLRFKDWRLAIMAYNAGGTRIQRGINDTDSRNPWTLIDQGHRGDKNYLAKVMAGVLILKNPSLIN